MTKSIRDHLLDKYGPTMMLREVAEALRVTTKTLWARKMRAGDYEIPYTKHGRRLLFQTEDVAKYIEDGKQS